MKSISIVHTGYAVAASTTRSSVAFCSVLVVSHRATWAVLPWTLVTLAWLLVYRQARPDTPKRGTGNLASGSILPVILLINIINHDIKYRVFI